MTKSYAYGDKAANSYSVLKSLITSLMDYKNGKRAMRELNVLMNEIKKIRSMIPPDEAQPK
jgi:hypothetical protein